MLTKIVDGIEHWRSVIGNYAILVTGCESSDNNGPLIAI